MVAVANSADSDIADASSAFFSRGLATVMDKKICKPYFRNVTSELNVAIL
jgi:hypothetical protein